MPPTFKSRQGSLMLTGVQLEQSSYSINLDFLGQGFYPSYSFQYEQSATLSPNDKPAVFTNTGRVASRFGSSDVLNHLSWPALLTKRNYDYNILEGYLYDSLIEFCFINLEDNLNV